MLHRVRGVRDRLLGTLWFVPTLIVAGALLLAVGMVELSAHVDDEALARWPRVFGASASSSRSILSAVASGMITVAGLSFSLTMVAVTQASSQYTPRILRNYLGDRPNQFVLGTFVGIFAYCLVVLRTIRSADDDGRRFVPSLAVVLGIVLAIVGVGVLIFFVHHIAATLQASSILARVSRETAGAIDRLFPEALGDEAGEAAARAAAAAAAVTHWHPVPAGGTGYVQSVDQGALADLAGASGRLVRMERSVGEFVVEAAPLAWIAADRGAGGLRAAHPASGRVPARRPDPDDDLDRLARRVARAYTVGENRTVEQDAAFGLRQLVDVALKALSPGVNDSTTATSCVDYLGALLVRLAPRRVESPVREADGEVRVLARGPTFELLLRLACDEVRQNAGGNPSVLHRLVDVLAQAGAATGDAGRRRLVAEQVALVREVVARTVEGPQERARLLDACGEAAAALRASPRRAAPRQAAALRAVP
jgi:uncharacterized membrane protein